MKPAHEHYAVKVCTICGAKYQRLMAGFQTTCGALPCMRANKARTQARNKQARNARKAARSARDS